MSRYVKSCIFFSAVGFLVVLVTSVLDSSNIGILSSNWIGLHELLPPIVWDLNDKAAGLHILGELVKHGMDSALFAGGLGVIAMFVYVMADERFAQRRWWITAKRNTHLLMWQWSVAVIAGSIMAIHPALSYLMEREGFRWTWFVARYSISTAIEYSIWTFVAILAMDCGRRYVTRNRPTKFVWIRG